MRYRVISGLARTACKTMIAIFQKKEDYDLVRYTQAPSLTIITAWIPTRMTNGRPTGNWDKQPTTRVTRISYKTHQSHLEWSVGVNLGELVNIVVMNVIDMPITDTVLISSVNKVGKTGTYLDIGQRLY